MKFALVTGAGSGIGRAAAHALMGAGWHVTLVGRRADALTETAGSGPATVLAGDVGVPAEVDRIFAAHRARHGRLDLLFNNAGRGAPAVPIDELPVDTFLDTVAVNLIGSVLCARAAFGIMRHQDPQGGRIINNGSLSAYVPRPHSIPYSTTKHAITGLTRCLALDGRAYGIAAGQLDIGNAVTPLTERMAEGVLQANGDLAPEPRMDVAQAGAAVLHMANQPPGANVLFMTVMATTMPFTGRG